MKINWKVRFMSKTFWLAFIPAVALVVMAVANVFNITLDLSATVEKLKNVVAAVFGVLALLGVVVDPTTKGVSDSDRAMTYDEPGGSDEV